ncbi:MAG: 6-bladed beta-propeller [Woeseiaceae bacterium]|nr:6-bladed beta-propeller [Woeseiaceae bacterium]
MNDIRTNVPILRAVACLVSAVLLFAMAPSMADDKIVGEQPLFLPLPPNEPRLQFLTKFSSALDISTEKKGFRDFVFGGEDKEAQLVQKPYGLAVHEGAIYVVDTRGNGYGIFDLANSRSKLVRPTGAGALAKPINITIDTDGTRYITDTDREQVLVFSADDRFLRAIGEPGQFSPVDVAIAGSRMYVTDIMNHQIHVLDKASGETIGTFGEAGSEPGQLFHPTNLAIGSDGTIYVTDTSNFRLQQFDADGNFVRAIGTQGSRPGTFSRPKGIALDHEGHIYVVDAAFQNIQVLDADGGALMAFGEPGAERWNINLPTVVKIDYQNVQYFEKFAAPNFEIEYLVFVASQYGLNRVVVFGYGELRE